MALEVLAAVRGKSGTNGTPLMPAYALRFYFLTR